MSIEKFLKSLQTAAEGDFGDDALLEFESPYSSHTDLPSNRTHWILPIEDAQSAWKSLAHCVRAKLAACHDFRTCFQSWDSFFDYLDSAQAKQPIFWVVSDADLARLGGLMLTPPTAWAEALVQNQHLVVLTRKTDLLRVPAVLAAGGFSRACLHSFT